MCKCLVVSLVGDVDDPLPVRGAVASRDWSCCSQVSSLPLMVAGTVIASPSTLVKGVNEILR